MTVSEILRWAFTGIGAVLAALEPTLPYMLICTLAILYDCYTAWSLDRRVSRLHPHRKDGGKFKSRHFGKVIATLLKSYSLIVLAFLIDEHISYFLFDISYAKVVAGAICFWQLWSILENESSCNGSTWAKIAQKFLVDKTSRHIGIDLSLLEKMEEEENNDCVS